MDTMYFEITDGSVQVGITITELADGSLKFDLDVLNDTGVIGDLNGLFFDMADDSIVDNLQVTGDDLTGENLDANSVTKVDGYNNVNGEVVKEDGKFDIGVQFGTSGIGADDIQSTTFYLSSDDGSALSLADVTNQDFAVRLTSVGDIDGARNGSVKISGTSEPVVVEPPVDPGPENIAVNNSMTVSNQEAFNPFGLPDPLDEFQFSLLDNDTTDNDPYLGEVIAVGGQTLVDGLIVNGTNGGQLIVNADGTVDVSVVGDFDYLTGDETATTQFNYTIEGGSTATLDVLVFVFDDTGGGGGGLDGGFGMI